jgi:hypothetical protein
VALTESTTAPADFRAIIFVGTQMAARAAVAHLSIRAAAGWRGRNEACGSGLSWVRPGMLLGQNAMKKARQCEALEQFRRGDINVLMATSIAEEGLDIQRCGIVIRTEPPRYECANLPGYEYAPSPGRTSEPCERTLSRLRKRQLFWFLNFVNVQIQKVNTPVRIRAPSTLHPQTKQGTLSRVLPRIGNRVFLSRFAECIPQCPTAAQNDVKSLAH